MCFLRKSHWLIALNLEQLLDLAIKTRDKKVIAKLLSAIEEGRYRELPDNVFSEPKAHIIGITGAPGVGKSSLINHIVAELRRESKSVAILAIDPSSPVSGGSFLGNRVRVRSLDDETFFRSISTPPEQSIPIEAMLMMELFNTIGFDYIIIETPGAGQVNVSISDLVDTTVVVLQPLAGDDIQSLKAGLMEVGDIYVINKSDLPSVDIFELQLKMFLGDRRRGSWNIKIIRTCALSGNGVKELIDIVKEHLKFLESSGERIRKVLNRRLIIAKELINRELNGILRRAMEAQLKQVIDHNFNPIKVSERIMASIVSTLCRDQLLSGGGSTDH